jgi:hypothetical protein
MESEKFNNLCSHYKDTFDNHKKSIKQRDMLFYILLLVLATFTLQLTEEHVVEDVIEQYSGIKIGNDVDFISTLGWLLLLGFTARYFQVVIEIERQYEYLHYIEKQINKFYKGTRVFTKEGKTYLSRYPLFLDWIRLLYTLIFPVIIVFSILIKICGDIYPYTLNIIDILSFFIITISTILYMYRLHEKSIERIFKNKK